MTARVPPQGAGEIVLATAGDLVERIWREAALAIGAEVRLPGDGVGSTGFPGGTAFLAICRHLLGTSVDSGRPWRGLAAVRLRAALADRWGLRPCYAAGGDRETALAVRLPNDPIHGRHRTLLCAAGREADLLSLEAAQLGYHRAAGEPFQALLEEALASTSRVALSVSATPGLSEASPWCLARPPHPLGLGNGPLGETCSSCAWNSRGRCLQVEGSASRIPRGCPSCARWEPVLVDESCRRCGACCREGFSYAPVLKREAMREKHPEWLVRAGRRLVLPRPSGKCVALDGSGTEGDPWTCREYADRPKACSGLSVGSRSCLEARRRAGVV
ncbi:MAG: YkgJ family cysteine cluster protein [Fibrobacteria bacterium]|nr:YkgJ family cysteine cluster protein [Fibrobacteria bacterium]